MAGAGAKKFAAFSKLASDDVNNYLADQVIMRFATTTARDASFGGVGEPTLSEGMTAYIDADNSIYTYDGSNWVKMVSASQPVGLVLLKTEIIGTGVSSFPVSNVFTSEFDSYEIVYSGGVSSVTEVLYLQLSGITGTNYYSAGAQNTSGSGAYNGIGASAATRWQIGTCTTTSHGLTMTVHNPFLTKNTYYRSNFASDYTSGWAGGVCNITTSTTGFSLIVGSGTLTGGTITVYGYRK